MDHNNASEICKKYVDLLLDIYDKYHELKSKKDYFENECDIKDIQIDKLEKENKELQEKYDKLCKDIVNKHFRNI